MLRYIGNFILMLLYIYVFFDFFGKKYTMKYRKYIVLIILFIIFTFQFLISIFFSFPLFNSLSLLFVILISCEVLYQHSNKSYILYCTYLVLYIVVIDIVTLPIFTLINNIPLEDSLNIDSYYFVTAAITSIITFGTYRIFSNILLKYKMDKVSILEDVFMLLQFIFQIYIISHIFSEMKIGKNHLREIEHVIITVLLILFDFIQIKIYESVSASFNLKEELLLKRIETLYLINNYKEIENKYQELRYIHHDIYRHLSYLESLYQKNNNAAEYHAQIKDKLDKIDYHFFYENFLLNQILNSKATECKKKNIKFIINIQNEEFDFIEEYDLVTILENIFSNAIEACDLQSKNKRMIKFFSIKHNDMLYLNLWNSSEELPKIKNDKFLSSKKNHMGLGLKNVQNTLNKYNGKLDCEYTNEYFKVSIFLPVK